MSNTVDTGKPVTTQANYPDTLSLNGVEYRVQETPELKKFFDSIITITAQREKNKLYSDIDKARNSETELQKKLNVSNQQLQHVMTINQQQLADYQKAQLELAELRKGNANNAGDIAAVVERAFKEHMPPLMQQYLTPVTELTQDIKMKSLTDYRNRRIEAEGGEDAMFTDMVRGESPDEIDQSIRNAKKYFEQAKAKFAPQQQQQQQITNPQQPQQGQQQVQQQGQQTVPVVSAQQPVEQPRNVIVPVVGSHSTPGSTDIPDIKGMTPEQFEQHRDQLFNKVKSVAEQWQAQANGQPVQQ